MKLPNSDSNAIVVGSLCAIIGMLWARGEWAGVVLGVLCLVVYALERERRRR